MIRERRNVLRMQAKQKMIKANHVPIAQMFRAVGIKQEPGSVLLQVFADTEQKKLLTVAKLNSQSIDSLCDNIKAAAGLHVDEGLIWTPKTA